MKRRLVSGAAVIQHWPLHQQLGGTLLSATMSRTAPTSHRKHLHNDLVSGCTCCDGSLTRDTKRHVWAGLACLRHCLRHGRACDVTDLRTTSQFCEWPLQEIDRSMSSCSLNYFHERILINHFLAHSTYVTIELGTSRRLSVCPSSYVTDVLWLNGSR